MLSLILALAVSAGEFTYDPQGRRDPFVGQPPATQRESLVQEVKLTGIVRTPRGHVALLESSDGRTHFLGVGGRIHDGTVVAIDADGVTIRGDDRGVLRLHVSR